MEKQPFSIYEVDQTQFSQSDWIILPPREQSIERQWAHLPTLGEFLTVRLGYVSGADDIFILPEEDILGDDTRLFVPMRSDREMKIYRTPEHVTRFAFYPFVAGRKITEEELKEDIPPYGDIFFLTEMSWYHVVLCKGEAHAFRGGR